MDQAAKNHWQKIKASPDLTMHSLLGEPWELWLENKKSAPQSNIGYWNIPVDELPENAGQTNPNYVGWIYSPLTGWSYKQ